MMKIKTVGPADTYMSHLSFCFALGEMDGCMVEKSPFVLIVYNALAVFACISWPSEREIDWRNVKDKNLMYQTQSILLYMK